MISFSVIISKDDVLTSMWPYCFLDLDIRSMTDLITAIIQRVGDDINRKNLPQILVGIGCNCACFFLT